MPVNDVFLAALSQVTEQIRLGFGVTLTPSKFRHPVHTAENVAAVDLLSRGRVEWGTGRSIPHEQKAFGVDPATSRDSWKDAIEAVVAMWEQEKFSWDSEFMKFPEFPSYEGDTRSITPKPYQDPHPPAWMAAVSPDSVELAGRLGLGMLSLTIMQPSISWPADQDLPRGRRKLHRADHTGQEHQGGALHPGPLRRGHGQGEVIRPMGVSGLVVRPHGPVHHRLGAPPQHAAEEIDKAFPRLRETQAGKVDPNFFNDQDMIIVGDPEQCLEKLKRYEDIGCDSVICYMQFGQLKHTEVMETHRDPREPRNPQARTASQMRFIVRRPPSGGPAVMHLQGPFGMAFAKVSSGVTELAAVPLRRADRRRAALVRSG